MSGGEIDRWEAPGEGARGWCAPREAWPVEPLRTKLRFVQGEAVALDGNEMPGHELLDRQNIVFAPYRVASGRYNDDTTDQKRVRTGTSVSVSDNPDLHTFTNTKNKRPKKITQNKF